MYKYFRIKANNYAIVVVNNYEMTFIKFFSNYLSYILFNNFQISKSDYHLRLNH